MDSVKYTKRSITIPTDTLRDAQRFAPDGNLSAYVSAAVRRQVERDNLASLVAELEEIHGAADPDEVARWARKLS
ncbi:MAG: hypothetical protein LBK95_17075 [Bifidobacteriaceae bacterium]|nr:hypothetical protein [Bifidobacteriaceae bacterium]